MREKERKREREKFGTCCRSPDALVPTVFGIEEVLSPFLLSPRQLEHFAQIYTKEKHSLLSTLTGALPYSMSKFTCISQKIIIIIIIKKKGYAFAYDV